VLPLRVVLPVLAQSSRVLHCPIYSGTGARFRKPARAVSLLRVDRHRMGGLEQSSVADSSVMERLSQARYGHLPMRAAAISAPVRETAHIPRFRILSSLLRRLALRLHPLTDRVSPRVPAGNG